MSFFQIIISSIFVNNFVMSRFLGICPFLGVSKKVETSLGMGAAVTFVMAISSTVTYMVQKYILKKFEIEYMQTIAFILIIAALVQLVELFLKKSSPTLYQALGVFLPLITTNCAVLGIAIMNIDMGLSLLKSITHAVGASIGFTLALVLFAGIRERLALADIPESLQGTPIILITAGLMSMAFLGFTGLI